MNCSISERLEHYEIVKQKKYFNQNIFMEEVLDAVDAPLFVINEYRQLVHANKTFTSVFGGSLEEYLGKRPGEIIKCTFSYECASGCGTSRACEECNLFQTIQDALLNKNEKFNQVTISKKVNYFSSNLNFKVKATPLNVIGETFLLITLSDITDKLRNKFLEKYIFVDMEKLVKTVRGFFDSGRGVHETVNELDKDSMKLVFNEIDDEISYLKQLDDAENNKLKLHITEIDLFEIINSQAKHYEKLCKAENYSIKVNVEIEHLKIRSDKAIVKRVLGNMIKNAIEATEKGGEIFIGCNKINGGSRVEFWVKNNKYIDKSLQWRVFENTFSTKGDGRGFGTYYIKLFTEKFLSGEANFESTMDKGTRFYVRLPLGR